MFPRDHSCGRAGLNTVKSQTINNTRLILNATIFSFRDQPLKQIHPVTIKLMKMWFCDTVLQNLEYYNENKQPN